MRAGRSVHTSSRLAMAKLYSSKHEWVELVGDTDLDLARVGVTQYAADALGDVVFAQVGARHGGQLLTNVCSYPRRVTRWRQAQSAGLSRA